METIFFKSPTRVDLSGGTLDLWPLYNFVGGACTINVAIDIWTSCEIKTRSDREVIFKSTDLNEQWRFQNINEFFTSSATGADFYKTILKKFKDQLLQLDHGFELTTSSLSPIGGGLGGSSSLVISILKSLHQLLKIKLPQSHELVHLAHNIEAEMLRTPTGTQDYYPAVTGGLSVIQYNAHHVQQKVYQVEGTPLKDHFLLVYTGKSHHSGLNNFEVFKSCVSGDEKVLQALSQIRDISNELNDVFQKEQWSLLPDLFKREYQARILLTPAFTSPEIERLNQIGREAGASALKICGAGGGGCVLLWVSPDKRQDVIEACEKDNFKCLPAKPVEPL